MSQEATVRIGHRTNDWFKIGKGVWQGCILSSCLFNLYAEYTIRSPGLDKSQAGVKFARRNINNLRCADDTTLMAESEEEQRASWWRWKRRVKKLAYNSTFKTLRSWPLVPFHGKFCCSLTKSCLTLCSPIDCSTPGFPVFHHLPEFSQTHLHWVSDVIQPFHPLSPTSLPALNLSQHQGLFQWVGSLHQVAKVLELQLQHQSCQWIFWVDFPKIGLISLLSKGLSIIFSTTFRKHQPSLCSIQDHWENHSFDRTDFCLLIHSKLS